MGLLPQNVSNDVFVYHPANGKLSSIYFTRRMDTSQHHYVLLPNVRFAINVGNITDWQYVDGSHEENKYSYTKSSGAMIFL
jgi:hypothetical protein